MRFMISHPDGRNYELTDVGAFQREYQPAGFAIDQHPPHGYEVPEVKAKKVEAAVKPEPVKGEGKAT